MIDTIKFFIPIVNVMDLVYLRSSFTEFKKEDLATGAIEFVFYTSTVHLGSFDRTIAIKMCDNPQGFFIEFSIPKYAKGNNVEMIHCHDIYGAIESLYNELKEKVNFTFPHFSKWQIYKLDICYNWIFDSEERAVQAMQLIQRIDYPRKKKYVYDTSVMYKGSAYTIKFYLKGPEFKKHDFKVLEINRAMVIYGHAKKILRFEVALKRQYLQELLGYDKVTIFHILDDKKIEEILRYYLSDKVFKYFNFTSTDELNVEEILYRSFSRKKATMLYIFYKNYYFDTPIKDKITSGGFSISTIRRYKKDLKNVGIGFNLPDKKFKNVLEELIIPSPTSKFNLDI